MTDMPEPQKVSQNKKVTIGPRPDRRGGAGAQTGAADQWVSGAAAAGGEGVSAPAAAATMAVPAVPMKRLTIDVSADLHKRIKVGCAQKGTNIADELRELLERHFPGEQKGVG